MVMIIICITYKIIIKQASSNFQFPYSYGITTIDESQCKFKELNLKKGTPIQHM